jgi:3-deoxy-D-manno-octulosonic-acid transferase
MGRTLYRAVSDLLWFLAGPWFARKRRCGGTEWRERLGELPASSGRPVWVHAASVGEVAAAGPVVRELTDRGLDVLLTTMTPTGRQSAVRTLGDAAGTAFVPLDFVPAVRLALSRVRPRSLVLVESELWPNLVHEARAAGVPVGAVNARFSARALRAARLPGSPLGATARSLDVAACRSDDDAGRLLALGLPPTRVAVTGDTKYDTLPGPLTATEREALRSSMGVDAAGLCVIFGSVRPREETHVVRAVAGLGPMVRSVVAPRHMRRVVPIGRALERAGLNVVRRSEKTAPEGEGVLLLDTTGELARVYGAADVAFVGGTLGGYGGHNPLEPAARGVPVVLGPDTRNCAGAAERLVAEGGAAAVADGAELGAVVEAFLDDDGRRRRAGAAALAVVEAGRGAARRSVDVCEEAGLLKERL